MHMMRDSDKTCQHFQMVWNDYSSLITCGEHVPHSIHKSWGGEGRVAVVVGKDWPSKVRGSEASHSS